MNRFHKLTLGAVLVQAPVLVALGLVATAAPVSPRRVQDTERQSRIEQGRELAAQHCATCHLEPAPDILPKQSWETALAYMGLWLGMQNFDYLDDHPTHGQDNVRNRRDLLERENVLNTAPVLTDSEWEALRFYYVDTAPASALEQVGKPELSWELPRFDLVQSDYRFPAAVTTLVHIRQDANEVYIGDSALNTLTVLGADGQIKVAGQRLERDIFPVDIEFIGDTAYVGSIGDLEGRRPTEERAAHIAALGLVDQSIESATSTVVIDDLYRMADMEILDLNGDDRLDFIVCGFGYVTGNVSWFESQPDGGYRQHILIDRAGGSRVQVADLNDDQWLDIVVLVSEGREGLYVLENNGRNEFESRTIFETQPAYGHTTFELQDFNDDGLLDALVVNGDNVDSDPYNTRKNYHGVRIYLNRGRYRFEEAYFYPMYGAFAAKSADFDNDGDRDIAAVSFYPDFSSAQREAFVYLENQGNLEFTASTTPELMGGRWMTMDVGDIDGDTDADVVLGGVYLPLGMFGHLELFRELEKTGPSVLILKNTLH